MTTMTTTPRVWVGCLGCYNAGHLMGEWFDAEEAPEDVDEWGAVVFDPARSSARVTPENRVPAYVSAARQIHVAEGHEELWVFDHEGFCGLLDGRECSPSEARELAEVLDSVDDTEAFGAYVRDILGYSYAAEDWDAAKSSFEDAYAGEWQSGADYVQEYAEDCGLLSVPAEDRYSVSQSRRTDLSSTWPFTCIDWERAWRELELSDGDRAVDTGRGTVWIFRAF